MTSICGSEPVGVEHLARGSSHRDSGQDTAGSLEVEDYYEDCDQRGEHEQHGCREDDVQESAQGRRGAVEQGRKRDRSRTGWVQWQGVVSRGFADHGIIRFWQSATITQ
jgi:hypothetical protein